METSLRDPKIDIVRAPFLEALSRFCLLMAFGNFLCIAPLYLIFHFNPNASPLFGYYTTLLTAVGILLTALGLLCRYQSRGELIAKICVAILFIQACLFLYHSQSLEHPTVVLFPLLCFLSIPILGIDSTYGVAIAGVVAIFILNTVMYPDPYNLTQLSRAALISLGIWFSAYISSVLWKSVLLRERALKSALAELRTKTDQVEKWAQQLAHASTSFNDGDLSLALPVPPPHHSFKQLTENVGEMQERLGKYFGQLVIQDRLNTVGVLATGLAHELNTPLTSIQFLLDTNKDNLPPDFRQNVEDEVKRMGSITQNFLTFASPHQSGETIDLNDIIRAALPLLDRIHSGKALLAIELTEEPITVRAIKTQIEQVLLNLFKNSLDASKAERLVFRITTRIDKFGYGTLLIEDNGTGIPGEILPKIFDPFFSTKSVGKGTGLGLFIVKEIVQSHGAELKVNSRVESGTSFTINFPIVNETVNTKVANG